MATPQQSRFKDLAMPVLRVVGEDRERYLQGRVTQDLSAIAENSGALSLLLSPNGKIQGQFFIFKQADAFLLLLDPVAKEALQGFVEELLRFKVADDVVVEPETGLSCFVLLNEKSKYFSPPPEKTEYTLQATSMGDCSCHCFYASDFAWNSLVVIGDKEELFSSFRSKELVEATEEEYTAARIKAGYPLFGVDVTSKNVAPDLPLSARVSFRKGCYAGQEVVEMASARGRANKVLVKIESSSPLPEGGSIVSKDSGKSIGTLTSVADRIGLGLIKNPGDPSPELLVDNQEVQAQLLS